MRIRVLESAGVDILTIERLLKNADRQANFHPDSRWILSARLGTQSASRGHKINDSDIRSIIDYEIKWIGRESVIMWLISNQIKFQVLSYELLKEEQDALDTTYDELAFPENPSKLN